MATVDRRDFLKLSGVALLYALTPRDIVRLLPQEFQIPSVEEVKSMNRNPDFWKKNLGKSGNSIFVRQFDNTQYTGYENSNYNLDGFMNNSCGYATLTMVRRWAEYIFTGDIPDKISIINTYHSLIGKTYTAGRNKNINPIVNPDGRATMSDLAIKAALEALDSKTAYYTVIETTPPIVTSQGGRGGLYIDNPHPPYEWQEIFEKTNSLVTEKGGISVVFISKYGLKNKPGAHISLCPFIPEKWNEDVLYVDPRGYSREGIVETGPLTKYTGLLVSVFGVVPNIDSCNRLNQIM